MSDVNDLQSNNAKYKTAQSEPTVCPILFQYKPNLYNTIQSYTEHFFIQM